MEQIGKALNEVAVFGEGYGVQIRLEIHGTGTQELPNIKTIMDVADHSNATVCWNCNPTDLNGNGLESNFNLVKNRLGTIHIHDLISNYPWPQLFDLLKKAEVRRLDARGRRKADDRSHPRHAVLPAGLGTDDGK